MPEIESGQDSQAKSPQLGQDCDYDPTTNYCYIWLSMHANSNTKPIVDPTTLELAIFL